MPNLTMKKHLLLLALPLVLAACKKEPRSITYPLHPHAGYATNGTAMFTENGDQTDITVKLYNLIPAVNYVGHVHPGDTSTYNSSPIIVHLGSFTPTGTEYEIHETWDKPFDEVLTYDGCIAFHNPNIGVTLGNIGSNAD